MAQSSAFLYFVSLGVGYFLAQAGCCCRVGNLCIVCASCILLFGSYRCLDILFFFAANSALAIYGNRVAACCVLLPVEGCFNCVSGLAGVYRIAYGVLFAVCLTGSSIGHLHAVFIGAGAFGLCDLSLCSNRLAQLNRNGIIIDQAVALILFCFANGRANQRIKGYGIGSVIVLCPLRILCSIGMTRSLYDLIVLCLVLIILRLLLVVIRIAAEAVLLRFGRLLYRLAANRANIAVAGVPFIGLIAIGVLLLGEVGLIEMDVMMIAGFLLVLGALSSDAGHCLGTSQVGNPHELIVVVGLLGVSELLQHGIVILIAAVAIIVRIVIALFKLVTIAIVLAVNGIVLVIGRLCAVGNIVLTGDIRQIGCNRYIQISVCLQADACNRMLAEGKVCAICAVNQCKGHTAECIGLVALAVNSIVLLDRSDLASGQVIAQDIIGQVEVQLAVIQSGSDRNGRIDVSLLCMLCIQFSQHIIGLHLLAFRIVYLNYGIILVGIRLIGEINQGRIVGVAVAGILIGDRVADQLILWVVLREVLIVLLRIVELLNQIGRIIYIVHVRAVRADIGLCTSEPSILIGLIGSDILISCIQLLEVAVIQISRGRVAEHEVHMVHVTIGLHAITLHNLGIAVGIARVNIIPLAVYLDCVPEMVRVEVVLRLTIHGNACIKGDTNQVYAVVAGSIYLLAVFAEGVQILSFFPVFSLGHVGICAICAVDLRMHVLNQVSIRLGVAQANRLAFAQRTDLVAFPVVDNRRSQLLCCLFGVDRNCIVSSCLIGTILIQIDSWLSCHSTLRHLLNGCHRTIFLLNAVFFCVLDECISLIAHLLCSFFAKVLLYKACGILGNCILVRLHVSFCLFFGISFFFIRRFIFRLS